MISIITGIIKAMTRFTKRFVSVRSLLASSNLFSSCLWVLKARITSIPERISLVTRFSLSTMVWMLLNLGMTMLKSTDTKVKIAATAMKMIHPME